jgi:hypothetical protein
MSNSSNRNRHNHLRAVKKENDVSHLDPRLDPNQMAAMRAQMQQIEFNQHMQNQNLMTQQSALALDAAKYIIDHREDGYCLNPGEVRDTGAPPQMLMFSAEEVHSAFDTVATVATIFKPQVQPPPIPEGGAADGALPEHKSAAPDIPLTEAIPEGMAKA